MNSILNGLPIKKFYQIVFEITISESHGNVKAPMRVVRVGSALDPPSVLTPAFLLTCKPVFSFIPRGEEGLLGDSDARKKEAINQDSTEVIG